MLSLSVEVFRYPLLFTVLVLYIDWNQVKRSFRKKTIEIHQLVLLFQVFVEAAEIIVFFFGYGPRETKLEPYKNKFDFGTEQNTGNGFPC